MTGLGQALTVLPAQAGVIPDCALLSGTQQRAPRTGGGDPKTAATWLTGKNVLPAQAGVIRRAGGKSAQEDNIR